MRVRLTGTLGIACLVVAALATACDRKTPSAPDGASNRSDLAGGGTIITVPTSLAGLILFEGGDVCIPVTAETVVLVKNTRLTCDTRCLTTTTPCFQFGAPGIKLELNGHRVWGPAEPPANCEPPAFQPGDGIAASGQNDIVIHGPGLVEKFRRHGIALTALRKATVKKLISHQNCFSGIWLAADVRETLVEEVVSVRNASASDLLPCGGICITNSHNNRIRRSEFSGNGSIVSGIPGGTPNDFGVGLVGASSGNIIEENGIGGNINGILVFPATRDNLIRNNVIAGNPPVQIGSAPIGFDIRNFSTPASGNRFENNLCITSTGDPPCRPYPQFAGHQNN